MKLVVWDRLAKVDGSTDTFRFAFNKIKAKRQLKFEWSIQPELLPADILSKNGNIVRRFRMAFSSGFLNFPYIAGSKGTYEVKDEPIPVVNTGESSVVIANTSANPVPTQEVA
jgi:hypothetical protein